MELLIFSAIIAALAHFIVGMIWYAPFFLGSRWQMLAGTGHGAHTGSTALFLALGGLISASVFAFAMTTFSLSGAMQGMGLGFLVWAGFVAPALFTLTVFGKNPFELFVIDASFRLVSLLVMGAVIGVLV